MLMLACIWPDYRRSDPGAWACTHGGQSLAFGAIISHLGLFQNLRPAWNFAIDPPTWSIATEFQIYLLFPIILLPLFRKVGPILSIAVASIAGIILQNRFGRSVGQACPQYIGLFTMGMTAALVRRNMNLTNPHPLLRKSCVAVAIILFLAIIQQIRVCPQKQMLADFLTGGWAAAFLAWCGLNREMKKPSVTVRLLESRFVRSLGDISYPLYLLHYPIIKITSYVVHKFTPSAINGLVIFVVSIGISFAMAYALNQVHWPMRKSMKCPAQEHEIA